MRACKIALTSTVLVAVISCSGPAEPAGPSQRASGSGPEPCLEVVASTAGLSSPYWDHHFAETRLTELLGEHSIPYELGSGEWRLLVPPRLAPRARKLLGDAIDAENLAARVEPADPTPPRPYELPPAEIVRWPASTQVGSERFQKALWDRLQQEHIPRFVTGSGGAWTMYVRADKSETGRRIAAEMIAAAGAPAVVAPR